MADLETYWKDDESSRTDTSSTEDVSEEETESSDHDDQDLSIVEYARLRRLTKDYRSIPPLGSWCLPSPPTDFFNVLNDVDGLPELSIPETTGLHERWTLNEDGAGYLRDSLMLFTDPFDPEEVIEDSSRRELRMPSPLLSSDPQLDQARLFGKRETSTDLKNLSIVEEAEDEANGNMLQWSTRDPGLLPRLDREIKSEKMQIAASSLLLLRDITVPAHLDIDDELSYTPDIAQPEKIPARLSPPILPLTSPMSDQLSDLLENIQPTSSATDPTTAELLVIDDCLMRDDALDVNEQGSESRLWQDPDVVVNDASSPFPGAFEEANRTPSVKRELPEDLKIDDLLTPHDHLSSPFKKPKTVSFLQDLVQTIPSIDRPSSSATTSSNERGYDKFFDDVIDLSASAVQETEHEQLEEADSMMRMKVPLVDDAVPLPPWEIHGKKNQHGRRKRESEMKCQQVMLMELAQGLLHNERLWPGSVGIRDLVWIPVPQDLQEVAVQETIDDGSLGKYLQELSLDESPDPSCSLHKPAGLRILDSDEDDEEHLEELWIDLHTVDLGAAIRTRQHEIESEKPFSPPKATREFQSLNGGQVMNHSSQQDPSIQAKDRPNVRSGLNTLLTPGFSAGTAISRFMQVQTGKILAPARMQPVTSDRPQSPKDVSRPLLQHPSTSDSKLPVNHAFATPPIRLPNTPQTFIASASILTQRILMQKISGLYPSANLIERDFTARPSFSSTPSNQSEADLLLSPSTGLVLTTVQKIKQRPLPGQRATNTLLARLPQLSERYERIIVLVSEGAPASSSTSTNPSTAITAAGIADPARELDQNDTSALNNLIFSTRCLQSETQILYVPGGEDTLAHWTVALMTRYGSSSHTANSSHEVGDGNDIVHDETCWEVFLRLAGFNAFAAQSILGSLGRGETAAAGEEWGLAAFVAMSAEERRDRFAAMLGGTRVLDRVGRVLDRVWSSEGLGYMDVRGGINS